MTMKARHDLRRLRLRRPLRGAAHGAARLARARGRAPPERGAFRAPLRRGRAGRARLVQYPRRWRPCRDGGGGRGGQLRRRPGASRGRQNTSRRVRRRARTRIAGSPPNAASAGWCISRPSGPTRRATASTPAPRRRARRRCSRLPRGGDPAPLGRVRAGGRLLQPLRRMARLRPVLPISGRAGRGSSPSMSATWPRPRRCGRAGEAAPGVYELGGPEVATIIAN